MEVGENRDIYAEGAEDGQPGGFEIHGSGVGELFVEVKVEMADHYFVARQGFVDIVVREGHHRLLGGVAVFGAEIEINGHPL